MVMMKNRSKYFLILILLISVSTAVQAQISQTMYFLGFPQSNMANPGLQTFR